MSVIDLFLEVNFAVFRQEANWCRSQVFRSFRRISSPASIACAPMETKTRLPTGPPLSETKFPLAERQRNAANPLRVGPKRSFWTGPPTDVPEVLSSVSFMQRPH